MKHKNSFVGLKNMMRQRDLFVTCAFSQGRNELYFIIYPFFTQDIIRISSLSLNADHNSDPCHAKKIGIPYKIPRCSRWYGLRFPIPCLMIHYFDSSVCRRLFLDPLPLPPFLTRPQSSLIISIRRGRLERAL